MPLWVYGGIIVFMTMSSFGLPIPEELVLVSAGIVAYMAQHPAEYPPPSSDAVGVDLLTLAIVCFCAVLLSDLLIYFIGKFFGSKIINTAFFNKHVPPERFKKIENWFLKYSSLACGLFRFMPGVRFPGHLTCGMMNVPLWKFLAIDGLAALFSVPTQVLLVAYYGEFIVDRIRQFKLYILLGIGILFILFLLRKLIAYIKKRKIAEK